MWKVPLNSSFAPNIPTIAPFGVNHKHGKVSVTSALVQKCSFKLCVALFSLFLLCTAVSSISVSDFILTILFPFVYYILGSALLIPLRFSPTHTPCPVARPKTSSLWCLKMCFSPLLILSQEPWTPLFTSMLWERQEQ